VPVEEIVKLFSICHRRVK